MTNVKIFSNEIAKLYDIHCPGGELTVSVLDPSLADPRFQNTFSCHISVAGVLDHGQLAAMQLAARKASILDTLRTASHAVILVDTRAFTQPPHPQNDATTSSRPQRLLGDRAGLRITCAEKCVRVGGVHLQQVVAVAHHATRLHPEQAPTPR